MEKIAVQEKVEEPKTHLGAAQTIKISEKPKRGTTE